MSNASRQQSKGVNAVRDMAELLACKPSLRDNEAIVLPVLSCASQIETELSKHRPLDTWLNSFPPEGGFNWSISTEGKQTLRPNNKSEALRYLTSSFKAALFFNSFRRDTDIYQDGYTSSIKQMSELSRHSRRCGLYASEVFNELIALSQPAAYFLFEKFVFLYVCSDECSLNLTPQVHTDRDYGAFESAILSFSSKTDQNCGTIVYPLARVANDMELEEWIDSERFGKMAKASTPYTAKNGEVLVFSGRQGRSSGSGEPLGLPHVSPSLSSGDFRIVVLCRMCYN